MSKTGICFFAILTVTVFLHPSVSLAGRPAECDNVATSAGPVPAALAARCAGSAPEGVPPAFTTDMAVSPDGVLSVCSSMVLGTPDMVSTVGSVPFQPACDFADNDFTQLYCADDLVPATLISIDPATCAQTVLGTLGNTLSAKGFAWDHGSATMYMSAGDLTTSNLHTVDLTTPGSTLIGTMTTSPGNIAIGIDQHGDLYGVDIVTDSLHRFDKTTAVGTVIGPLGFDANFAQGMDFDHTDDSCYLFAFNNVSFSAELRTCSVVTGATTVVGPIGSVTPGGLQDWTGVGILTDDCRPLSLTITGSCPGTISVDVAGATPGAPVFFAGADLGGRSAIPGGPCAGQVLDLASPRLLTTRTADDGGKVSVSPTVGDGACGDSVQVVDGVTCCTSNVATVF